MSWYLKYRPHQIADLDLEDVKQIFLQLMANGQFPQTLLFAGPKGTGKTSASRIIGAMLNDPANEKAVRSIFFNKKNSKNNALQEPSQDSEFAQRVFSGQSYVVQEIDAASYRGIDDIRRLKERIFLPPQEGIMAVYILDEVHMLTNEAFNALLKILEEPPVHVVFILATTELHKVPATIVSRCNLVSFHKASNEEIIVRLKKILELEKIKYEEEALQEIARRSDGSFRDAVKLTEIAAQTNNITLLEIDKLIGGSALVQVKKLIKLILAKDELGIAQFFSQLRQENMDANYFYQSLFSYLHQNLLGSLGVAEYKPEIEQKISQFLLNFLLAIEFNQATPIAFLPLELKIFSLVERSKQQQGPPPTERKKQKLETPNTKQKIDDVNTQSLEKNALTLEKTQILTAISEPELKADNLLPDLVQETVPEYVSPGVSLSKVLCDHWNEFLTKVEENNSTLAALLRSSKPQAGTNGIAQVMVYYRFHQEQLEQPKFKTIIEKCGSCIVGDKIKFQFVLTKPQTTPELVDIPANTQELEALAEEALM